MKRASSSTRKLGSPASGFSLRDGQNALRQRVPNLV